MLTVDARTWDVLVVGTGPAGNSVALTCARAGLKVLQIERETLPRRKVCGGGISHKTLQELAIPIDPVIERRIDSVWVCAGPERALLQQLSKPGAMVCREKFDEFMAEAARSAGAHRMEDCALLDFEREANGLLRVDTSQGVTRTRVLVGADGVHSRVRRKLFPDRKVRTALAIEALVTPQPRALELLGSGAIIDFHGVEGGYAWVFPKSDHLNVGLYRLYKTRNNLDLKQALTRYIGSNPLLRGGGLGEIRGFEIPIQAVSPRLVRDQVLLVGDAAGLGEAFYGEGIYFAVLSGRKAGESIAAHLQRGAPLESYSRWARGLRRDLFASRLTANLFYRMPRFGFDWMVRNPFVNELFTGVVTGEVSPWRCLALTLSAIPYWTLKQRYPTTALPSLTDPRCATGEGAVRVGGS